MQLRYSVDIVSPKGEVLKRYGKNYLDIRCDGDWENGFSKITDVLKCVEENGLAIDDIYYIGTFRVGEENGTPTLALKGDAELSKVGKSCIKEAKALNVPCAVIYGRPVIKSFLTELNTVHTKKLTQKDKYLCVIKEAEGMLPRQAFIAHLGLSSDELFERINQPNAFQNLDSKLEENLNPFEIQHLELIQNGFQGGLKDPNVHLVPGMKLVGTGLGAIRVKTDDELEKDIANIREKELKKYNNVPILNPLIQRVREEIIVGGSKVIVEVDKDGPPTGVPPEMPSNSEQSSPNQYPTRALFFGFLFFFSAVPVYTFGYLMVTDGFTPGMLLYDVLTTLSQFLQLDPVVIVFTLAAVLTVVAIGCAIGSFCGGDGGSAPEVSTQPDHGSRKPIDEYMDLVVSPDQSLQSGPVFVPDDQEVESSLEEDDTAKHDNGLN